MTHTVIGVYKEAETMKHEDKKMAPEELAEVSGGTNPAFEARLTPIGRFRIIEFPRFNLRENEACVPPGFGINVGEDICVNPITYESKIVTGYYDYPTSKVEPVIVVGRFAGKEFGEVQLVKVWDR